MQDKIKSIRLSLSHRGVVLPDDTTRDNFLNRLHTGLLTAEKWLQQKKVRLSLQEEEDSGKELAEYYKEIIDIFSEAGVEIPEGIRDIIEEDLAETPYMLAKTGGKWHVVPHQATMSLLKRNQKRWWCIRLSTEDPWVRYEGKRGGKGWKNTKTGRIVYSAHKPGSSKERLAARKVDHEALKGRLEKHTKDVTLTSTQKGRIKSAMAALKRFHGEHYVARIDELHGELVKALDDPKLRPIDQRKIREKLAGLGAMLDPARLAKEEKPKAIPVKKESKKPEINYAHALTIAADSVEELRKQDVYRVLDSMQNQGNLQGMADYLVKNRSDLKEEVDDSVADIVAERGYGKPEAIPTKKAEEKSSAKTVASIEKDDEGNTRAVISLPDGEQFKGKWTMRTDQSPEELKMRAFREYVQREHANKPSAGSAAEAGEIDRQVNLRIKQAQKAIANDFRPKGSPEIVAEAAMASGDKRQYRIVPEWTADGIIYNAVYDVPADGVFGVEHERGAETYKDAVKSVAAIMERFPHVGEEDITFHDQNAKGHYHDIKAGKEQAKTEAADKELRERQEREESGRVNYAAQQALLSKYKTSGKKGTADIQRGDAKETVSGVRVGPFLVHKDSTGKQYAVSHASTGLKAGSATTQEEAKVLANMLSSKGNWDFTDSKKMDKETSKHGSNTVRMFRTGNWTDLHNYLEGEPAKTVEATVAPEPATEPVPQPPQPGFTGTTTDSLGRTYHWVNGERVASAEEVAGAQNEKDPFERTESGNAQADEIASVMGQHGPAGTGTAEEIKNRLNARGEVLRKLGSHGEAQGTESRMSYLDKREELIQDNKKDLAALERMEKGGPQKVSESAKTQQSPIGYQYGPDFVEVTKDNVERHRERAASLANGIATSLYALKTGTVDASNTPEKIRKRMDFIDSINNAIAQAGGMPHNYNREFFENQLNNLAHSGPSMGAYIPSVRGEQGGRMLQTTPMEDITNAGQSEPATDSLGSGRQPDDGRPDSGGTPGGIPKAPARPSRIITDRAEHTTPGELGLVPENLRPHLNDAQQHGVAKAIASLDKAGGFLLADGTGVGKSRQLLAIGHKYATEGKKVVIVAPAEVIKPDWKKGIAYGSYAKDGETMGVSPKLIKGDVPVTSGGLHITTYNELEKLQGQVDKDTVILFDESHYAKNSQSKRGKLAREISFNAGKVLYATATPADKPLHIAHLIRAGVFGGGDTRAGKFFGKSEDTYRKLGLKTQDVYNPYTGQTIKKWVVDPKVGSQEVARRISGLFDQMTKEGLMIQRSMSMDNVDTDAVHVTLPPEATNDITAAFDRGMAAGGKAMAVMAMRRAQEPHKIPATIDLVKQELAEGRAPIIFLGRVNDGDPNEEGDEEAVVDENTAKQLKAALIAAGIPAEDIGELHGAVTSTADAKRKAMDHFNKGKTKLLISTLQSGGTGVNLDDTVGDRPRTVIMMTPPLSANDMIQAAGRVNRLSTKSPAKIVSLVSDHPVDQWNMALLTRKLSTLGAVLGKGLQSLTGTVADEEKQEPFAWGDSLIRPEQPKPVVTSSPSVSSSNIKTRKVSTKYGEKYVHGFAPDQSLWAVWKSSKKPDYLSVRKNDHTGQWEASVWGKTHEEVVQNLQDLKDRGVKSIQLSLRVPTKYDAIRLSLIPYGIVLPEGTNEKNVLGRLLTAAKTAEAQKKRLTRQRKKC